jgi:hypothetical protein
MKNLNIDLLKLPEWQRHDISAPWGEFKLNSASDAIAMFVKQLEYFLPESPNPAFTLAEKAAYQRVLDSKSERNARVFVLIKSMIREKMPGTKLTNDEVIAYMHDRQLWESPKP